GYDDKDVQRALSGNPMVGPFYIEGAEPGDAIVVHFRRIRTNRPTAWSYYRLGTFSLLPDAVEHLYPNSYKPGSVRPNRNNLLRWDIDLVRNTGARLTNPRVENIDYVISVGSQREFVSTLDYALKVATTDMVRWLSEEYKLEPWAAHMMINAVGEYEVVTVAGSMALKVPKKHLPRREP